MYTYGQQNFEKEFWRPFYFFFGRVSIQMPSCHAPAPATRKVTAVPDLYDTPPTPKVIVVPDYPIYPVDPDYPVDPAPTRKTTLVFNTLIFMLLVTLFCLLAGNSKNSNNKSRNSRNSRTSSAKRSPTRSKARR